MKAKRTKAAKENAPAEMKDMAPPYISTPAPMIRTQIYLSKPEYEFLQAEGKRRDEPMAAVLRAFIDEKMRVPETVWENSPLLDPPVNDPDYKPRGDGVVNHDHYIYGGEKKYKKVKGKWALQPPLE
jgi:hypothetical protein